MSRREKRLAILVAGLGAVVAVPFLFMRLVLPPEEVRTQHQTLFDQVQKQEKRIRTAQAAQRRFDEWNRRSLPTDLEAANSLYQNWLLKQLDDVGLRDRNVLGGEHRPLGKILDRLPFTVMGRGSVEQVVALLHRFHSAGHLHKIRLLSLAPLKNSSDVRMTLSIEALVLPGADRKDRLSDLPGDRLAQKDPAAYDLIGKRSLFQAYRPPPPPAPPARPYTPPPAPPAAPPFRHADYLALTGTGTVDGRPQAWLLARTTGKEAKVFAGESFELGEIRGRVVRVHDRGADLELDGRLYRVNLGQLLKDAEFDALPSPAPEKAKP